LDRKADQLGAIRVNPWTHSTAHSQHTHSTAQHTQRERERERAREREREGERERERGSTTQPCVVRCSRHTFVHLRAAGSSSDNIDRCLRGDVASVGLALVHWI
jgi:hypothetical protein